MVLSWLTRQYYDLKYKIDSLVVYYFRKDLLLKEEDEQFWDSLLI